MNSGRVLAGTDGFTTMMFGKRMTEAMGAMSLKKLKLSFSYNVAFHALKLPAMTNVWPSGGARTTASVPMLPPAPGLFSMMNCWPNRSDSRWPIRRAVMSVAPAEPKGTMSRTGRVGYACARAMRDTAGRRPRTLPDGENFGGEVSFEPPFTSFDHLVGAG